MLVGGGKAKPLWTKGLSQLAKLSRNERSGVGRLVATAFRGDAPTSSKTEEELGHELFALGKEDLKRKLRTVTADNEVCGIGLDQIREMLADFNSQTLGHHFTTLQQAMNDNVRQTYPDLYLARQKQQTAIDLVAPHLQYPQARAIRRKIIYHWGPTNSGKTYMALEHLQESPTGIYAGPLRLLAREAFEKLNLDGVSTDLLTGQERCLIPFSTHAACTVEMVSTVREVDTVVIDEIQLMTDPSRGWAWTRALLASRAQTVHVCGDGSVLNLVRRFAQDCGDDFEVQRYERRSNLRIEEKSLDGDLSKLEAGDAVVVFSRDACYRMKADIEKLTRFKCCVVYGRLPPEVRTIQSRRFNDPKNAYNVLVATDAIGLGLNLEIGRVVFTTLSKFNGENHEDLPPPQIRQIAGRAGRAGSRFAEGKVSSLRSEDMQTLKAVLAHETTRQAPRAGLWPATEQLCEYIQAKVPYDTSVVDALESFGKEAIVGGSFELCMTKLSDVIEVAKVIDWQPVISIEEYLEFCQAPVALNNQDVVHEFQRLYSSYWAGKPIYVCAFGEFDKPCRFDGKSIGKSAKRLMQLETDYRILDIYIYLSLRFGDHLFVERGQAEQFRELAVAAFESVLSSGKAVPVPPRRTPSLQASHKPPHRQKLSDSMRQLSKTEAWPSTSPV